MTTPRLRKDLEAARIEEDGLVYVEVADPRAGTAMRLYEHEWALATHMDGQSSLEELADWAGANIGFSPSAGDLAVYARRLGELGFFDEPVEIAVGAPAARGRVTPPPQPVVAHDETSFGELADEPPASQTADLRPEVLAAVRAAAVHDVMKASQGSAREPDAGRAVDARSTPVSAPAVPPRRIHRTPETVPAVQAVEPAPIPLTPSDRKSPPAMTQPLPPLGSAAPPSPEPRAADEERPARSRAGLWATITFGGVVVVGAIAYTTFIAPALRPVHVTTQPVGAARDVYEYFDGKGTVEKAAPVTLSFGAGGRIVDVVPAGTETKPGMTLASLDTYATTERELADVRDRESFYENMLRVALVKHKAGDAKKAQAKVDEKKHLRAGLEERVAKARIVAPVAATVTDVLATNGTEVAAGAPVVRLADKHARVEVKLPAGEAKELKPLEPVEIALSSGSAAGAGKVVGLDGDTVKVEVTNDGEGAIKSGEAVQLVKAKLAHVMRVPAAALSKSQGGADQVFVLDGGFVRARRVTIARRGATDVYVSAGLQPGDRLVISSEKELADGQKALPE